ncbi:MAG: hypothetical protein Q9187_000264 [Circinaria calcarea]
MASFNISIITFNCGRGRIKPDVFARHIAAAVSKVQTPNLFVFSLQEIAPMASAFLGGSCLIPYFDRVRHTVDLAAKALGGDARYVSLFTGNVGMTAIMAFVREDLADHIVWMEGAGVGVGVQEMGNKGAVGLRIGYDLGSEETMEMTFVAAHLAAMENASDRRSEDWINIVKGLVFTRLARKAARAASRSQGRDSEGAPFLPGSVDNGTAPPSGLYSSTSHLFLAGDLNYRTSQVQPSPEDHKSYPQPTEDVTDPKHYRNLLKDDQLTKELQVQRTCHGLQEAPIDFPPTYKYSFKQRAVAETDAGIAWAWAKHRWPSWCDRVLYLDLPSWMLSTGTPTQIHVHQYTSLPLMSTSDHRPVLLSVSLPLKAIPPPDDEVTDGDCRVKPPFEINAQWRERRAVARRKEIAVGILAYLALTWEGNGILVATILGALGGWAIVSSVLGKYPRAYTLP